jgi:uncharacterized protein (TIGR02996 family)
MCGSFNITGRAYDTADGDELQERYCYDCQHEEGRMRSAGGVSWWVAAPQDDPHRLHTATGVERALLDEIYAAPDDDGVRSIYADWLIEQGDPLGNFIVLQLARAARKEPLASDEEQRLVDANWSRWIGEPTSILAAGDVAFERGFWSSCGPFHNDALTDRMRTRSWGTVRRLIVGDGMEPRLDDILALTRRSLRSVVVRARPLLARLAAAQLALEELELDFDLSRDPPPLTGFPQLRRLAVHCYGEFAERWLERADRAGIHELTLHAPAADLPTLVRAMKQARVAKLSIEVMSDLLLHVQRESDGNVVMHSLEVLPSRESAFDALNRAGLWLEGKADRSVKVTMPSLTSRLAEYAHSLRIRLVRAQACYPARPAVP